MSNHSPIGASVCERYWNCPGSITRYGDLKSPPTYWAAEGTAAHEIGELYLNEGRPVDTKLLGQVRTYEEDGVEFKVEVTIEMLEAVGEYVDYIQSKLEDAETYDVGCVLEVEKELHLPHIDEDAWGTADAILTFEDGVLEVIDYKHGKGVPVDIADNKQTLYYALAAYTKWELRGGWSPVNQVKCTIVQPRCPHPDGNIRSVVYSIYELIQFEKGLKEAVGRIRNGDETLKAGNHCKFCPGKPHCPEAKNEVARLAMMDFDNVDIPTGPPNVATLTPAQIAHLLQFVPQIKDWCDGLLSHAHSEAEAGVEIPGYKLVDKRANRQWKKDVEDELELLLGDRMYAPQKLVTPAAAEKLLPKKSRSALDSLWEKPVPGKTLVKDEDDRDARLPAAIADFADLDI